MGSVSLSSCRCCVSCVYPVAVLNAAFCMTCSLLMLVEDAIGDHNCLVGIHECPVYPILLQCVRVLRCCGCVCCM